MLSTTRHWVAKKVGNRRNQRQKRPRFCFKLRHPQTPRRYLAVKVNEVTQYSSDISETSFLIGGNVQCCSLPRQEIVGCQSFHSDVSRRLNYALLPVRKLIQTTSGNASVMNTIGFARGWAIRTQLPTV